MAPPLVRPRTKHTCHQKPNPSRETVLFKVKFYFLFVSVSLTKKWWFFCLSSYLNYLILGRWAAKRLANSSSLGSKPDISQIHILNWLYKQRSELHTLALKKIYIKNFWNFKWNIIKFYLVTDYFYKVLLKIVIHISATKIWNVVLSLELTDEDIKSWFVDISQESSKIPFFT
jgi:hypothetical protein